jgi:menaquinol-cytochrome c reductase iron-sulfur subunit
MNETESTKQGFNRRTFLLYLLMIWGAILGILVSIPIISSMLEPLFRKTPRIWKRVGKVDDFKVGETVLVTFRNADPQPWSGVTDKTSSWLRRDSENEFIAFAINCTHLGCPVRWIADAQLFLCPCHGGVYNKNGSRAAGPPPKGLNRYPVRIKENYVEILSSPLPMTVE